MITRLQQIKANQDLKFYSRQITTMKMILPENESRLKVMEAKLNDEKSFHDLWTNIKLYFPIIGLETQYNKLKSWVDLHQGLLPIWIEKKEYATYILKQWDIEHGQFRRDLK